MQLVNKSHSDEDQLMARILRRFKNFMKFKIWTVWSSSYGFYLNDNTKCRGCENATIM